MLSKVNAAGQAPGYYASRYLPAETHDLQAQASPGLGDEISLLRVMMRRVFDASTQEDASLEDLLKVMGVLSSAANRLANLMLTSRKLEDAADPAVQWLNTLAALLDSFQPVVEEGEV